VGLIALGAVSLVEGLRLREGWLGARLLPPALGAACFAGLLLVLATAVFAQTPRDADVLPPRDALPTAFPWAVTVYGGPFAKNDFLEFFTAPVEFDHAGMVSLALSREFGVLWKHLRWEAEIGVTKWFGDQTNWEFTSALVARWATFPWNDHLATTIAVGDGPSFATEPPRLEMKNFDEAKRLQNYVFFELTFGLPRFAQWDFVIRLHHRSGVFGLLGGSGSSVPTVGLKYRF
jgi:hypothetical protein